MVVAISGGRRWGRGLQAPDRIRAAKNALKRKGASANRKGDPNILPQKSRVRRPVREQRSKKQEEDEKKKIQSTKDGNAPAICVGVIVKRKKKNNVPKFEKPPFREDRVAGEH